MLILNGGMPRSGTVWAMNVIQLLLGRAGKPFNKYNANTCPELNRVISDYRSGNTLVHYHDVDESALDISRHSYCYCTYNFRDPRDVVVSQMNLHGVDFDIATQMTIAACKHMYTATKLTNVLLVPYSRIMHSPQIIISAIATHLDIVINEEDAEEIHEKTTIDKSREIMMKVRSGTTNYDSVNTGCRDIRFDPEHLITDRHIQSGKIGRWRDQLSPDQQNVVNSTFGEFLAWIQELEQA